MKRCSAIAAALLLLGLTAFWHSQPASGQAEVQVAEEPVRDLEIVLK